MLRFIIVLILLCLGLLTGYAFNIESPVMINIFGRYQIETHFINLVLASILFGFLFITLFRILFFIWNTPTIFSRNLKVRKKNKADRLLRGGLNDLGVGNYKCAEKKLAKGGDLAEQLGISPVIYFENAAIAADRQQAFDRRDQYFIRARETVQAHDAVSRKVMHLTEAHSYILNHQFTQAESILNQLYQEDAKNSKVIAMLDEVYVGKKDWERAWLHLSTLRNQLSAEVFNERKLKYAQEMVQAALHDEEALSRVWQHLPAELHAEKSLLLPYASALHEKGHAEEIEKLLAQQIKYNGDLDLIQVYSQLRGINFNRALKNMNDWASMHAENSIFLYCHAQIAYRAKDYETAARCIEASIKLHPTPQAFALWGQILEATDKPGAAFVAYRQSIVDPKADSLNGELLLAQAGEKLALEKLAAEQTDGDAVAEVSENEAEKTESSTDE